MSMPDQPVTACLLIIGNEILSGRTQDANLAYLGRRLDELGIRLMEARVIPDREDVIVETVNEVRRRFTYVFTTGGIGPTHDDITAACIAKAFGVPLIVNPEGASLIENPVSKAPGFRMGNVLVMAGIPVIMQAQFESAAPGLTGGKPLVSRSVTVDLPEGAIARDLGALQDSYPEVEMGSYPFSRGGRFGVRLVLRSTETDRIEAAAGELDAILASLGTTGMWD
jgi:molybdopterin-biosynthesis enzyme MoeA-like protein